MAWAALCLGCAPSRVGLAPRGTDGGIGDTGPVLQPVASCDVPPEGKPVDTSGSNNVVGNGTPESCTAAALQTAVTQAGIVTFNCGPNPVTITVTTPIVINNVGGASGLGDTVIDGANLVTLSGGGTSRILSLNACQQPWNNSNCNIYPHPLLVVQNLTFVDASDDSAQGGGAIYREGGELRVVHCRFFRNRCATTGQDTAGGAIRLVRPTPALIVDSVVGGPGQGNQCSNGGGVGSLQAAPVKIINSVIDSNSATGSGGNPGNGGNGGGIYHDGVSLDLELCGVTLTNNVGNAFGGGLFYVDNFGQGTVRISNSEISNNSIPVHSGQPSHGGATYLQGADVILTNTTAAVNSAGYAAGLYVNTQNGHGSLNATNVTVANTQGDGFTLAGGIGGTLLNCTISGNTTGISGADGMTLTNTLVSGNGTNCSGTPGSGGGSFQYPGTTCGALTSKDPLLGPLQDNGGSSHVRTMAPASGSPALGAGNGCPSTDARGEARPASGCTSGAYQSN